jgi:hypothetical protein
MKFINIIIYMFSIPAITAIIDSTVDSYLLRAENSKLYGNAINFPDRNTNFV